MALFAMANRDEMKSGCHMFTTVLLIPSLLPPFVIIGTSSRSTKLVHGGVRYLEKAVRELDIEQYKLVKEALTERANFLKIAPYLSYQLPIMLPIYK